MSEHTPFSGEKLSIDELFRAYPRLAARVTDLRMILQNPESLTKENAQLWAEDVQSVMNDFMQLCDLTRDYIRLQLTERSSHAKSDSALPPAD